MTKSVQLAHDFLFVEEGQALHYGGAQAWCRQKYMKKSGCGVVACADVIAYYALCEDQKRLTHTLGITTKAEQTLQAQTGTQGLRIQKEDFASFVEMLRKKYIPVLPYLGINGFVLMLALNRYFRKNQLPLRARWKFTHFHLWEEIEKMLREGLPVPLAVGPNLLPGRAYALPLYEKTKSGYRKRTQTRAHYVVVTGMEEEWLTISSWGRKYYINKQEYQTYSHRHSLPVFSNILLIHKQKLVWQRRH